MDIPLYSIVGQVVGQVTFDESLLGGRPNMELVRQAIVTHEANRRVGTAKTKTRSEVRGSGAKPWRQKHTGRARHGSRHGPIWVGGGTAHGPRPRDYRKKMNKAARRRALWSAFLAKAIDGEVMAVEELTLPEPKTREMAAILRNLGVDRSFLVVLHQRDHQLWRCTRNIPGAAMINAYEMTRPSRVIFTKEAIERFLDRATAAGAQEQVEVSENG
ncbi:MAG: 50S ribosomal protein L4 [Planctomycetota bacterium]|jgi:large subunit ribosomal protein L4